MRASVCSLGVSNARTGESVCSPGLLDTLLLRALIEIEKPIYTSVHELDSEENSLRNAGPRRREPDNEENSLRKASQRRQLNEENAKRLALSKLSQMAIFFRPVSSPGYRLELALPADVNQARLENRRSLLQNIDGQVRRQETVSAGMDIFYERAFSILASSQTRRAFDLSAEPDRVRNLYGRNKVGQSNLLARRLIEAGVRFVTCFNGSNPGDGWDTHDNNFNRLKNNLMPSDDQAFAALLGDMEARGLLDRTLVIWAGEFGRSPYIARAGATFVGAGGRDHWPQCYSVVFAGGGVKPGFHYGASDRIAAYPSERPTTPADLAATLYWAVGIDPRTEIHDVQGRPMTLTTGSPVTELFA